MEGRDFGQSVHWDDFYHSKEKQQGNSGREMMGGAETLGRRTGGSDSGEIQGTGCPGTWALHDVEINHGGFDTGVFQERLDGADVDAGLEEMRRPASLRYVGPVPLLLGQASAKSGVLRMLAPSGS